MTEDARRSLAEGRCSVPSIGSVAAGVGAHLPFVVLDGDGLEIEPVSVFLRDVMLGDASALTCRSYAFDLLRWHRRHHSSRSFPYERSVDAERSRA
jgi:hypothetical protein